MDFLSYVAVLLGAVFAVLVAICCYQKRARRKVVATYLGRHRERYRGGTNQRICDVVILAGALPDTIPTVRSEESRNQMGGLECVKVKTPIDRGMYVLTPPLMDDPPPYTDCCCSTSSGRKSSPQKGSKPNRSDVLFTGDYG